MSPLETPEIVAYRVMPPAGLILSPTELRERLEAAIRADREAIKAALLAEADAQHTPSFDGDPAVAKALRAFAAKLGGEP